MDITEQLTLELSAHKSSVLELENRAAARALLELLPPAGSEHSSSTLFRGNKSHPACALDRDYIEQLASRASCVHDAESNAASSPPTKELDARVAAAHGVRQLSSSEPVECTLLGASLMIEPGGVLSVRKESEQELRVRLASPAIAESAPPAAAALFRLGEERSYRRYVNEFTLNPLALNKQQHNEERDKRRYLQHKFSLSLPAELEFRWPTWDLFGGQAAQLDTIRLALCLLECSLPACFFHSLWSSFRASWFNRLSRYALADSYTRARSAPVQFTRLVH